MTVALRNTTIIKHLDLWPHERRVAFDRDWMELAQDFRHVSASSEPNSSGNCFHAEIRYGVVLMTASFVDDPYRPVRPACFRDTLSLGRQMWLIDEELPPEDAPLFAMLIHGSDAKNRKRPGFADIVFPSRYCLAYDGRIHLFERCAEVVRAMTGTEEENIPDDLQPHLRPPTGDQKDMQA